jgi:hypothetical protein
MAPDFGSWDVYMFRDAANNFIAGQGFTTFAMERQTSFEPHFYSSYTPGLLWLYIGFARAFGNTPRSGQIFVLIWTYLLDAVFFFVGLRFAVNGWIRMLFFGLLAILFPFAGLAIFPDRPEYVSLLLLTALLFLLSRPIGWKEAVFLAIVSLAAFLVEPLAGIFALFLIVGAWFAGILNRSNEEPPASPISTAKVATSILLFAIGLLLVVAIYTHIDPTSLHRFNQAARLGGPMRSSDYLPGDPSSSLQPNGSTPSEQATRHGRLWDIVASMTGTKQAMLQSVWYIVSILLVIGWMLRSKGPLGSRAALFALGLVCLIMPIVIFPNQSNYRAMALSLMAIALAFDWAGSRAAAPTNQAPALLLLLSFAVCAPGAVINYAIRIENRATYRAALDQASQLRSYLSQHGAIRQGVFLVPASHYYLYKSLLAKITTQSYLSAREDPSLVNGVVNCYAFTGSFSPEILSLPLFVREQPFQRILSKQSDIPFSSPMSKRLVNYTWECDVYVRGSRSD